MSEPRQFRKKPVIIEAMQWDGTLESFQQIVDWSTNRQLDVPQQIHYRSNTGTPGCPGLHEQGPHRYCDHKGCDWQEGGPTLLVTTTFGDLAFIRPGDWVIPDSTPGTFYPCKPGIFAATYEEVPDDDA